MRGGLCVGLAAREDAARLANRSCFTYALKTVPRGYDKEHPRVELLNDKGLIAWQEWEPAAWLSKPAAKDKVAGFLRTSAPLMSWLDTHVGESTAPSQERGR